MRAQGRLVVMWEGRARQTRPAASADLNRVMARGSKSFYLASRFLPRERANAAQVIYAFCRYTDDLADGDGDPDAIKRAFDAWMLRVYGTLNGAPRDNPLLANFAEVVKKYKIPHGYIRDFLETIRGDVEFTPYATFPDLQKYCYGVASVVGLMMSHVLGFQEGALPYAIQLGIAMQLTNILRDVGEDLGRGRIYLPRVELAQFRCSETELRRRECNDRFRDLMKMQIARADFYYSLAAPGISMLDREARFAIRCAAKLYQTILRRIEKNDYNVFYNRAVVPLHQKLAIVARTAIS